MALNKRLTDEAKLIVDGYAMNLITNDSGEYIVETINIHQSNYRLYFNLTRGFIIKTNMSEEKSRYIANLILKNAEFLRLG